MFSRTFNLIPNFMMQICDLELKINYCHRTNSIISSKVYRCIYTTHISKAVSNSETLSSFGQIACLNTRVSLYWNWNATIAILPVTTICSGPCLCLPDLSFFADITMVIKITSIQVPAQHYIYISWCIPQHSLLQAALIIISIKYLFPVETRVVIVTLNNG